MSSIILFLNRVCKEFISYSGLTKSVHLVYEGFKGVSKKINKVTVLKPELLEASKDINEDNLFLAGPTSVMEQLDFLKSALLVFRNLDLDVAYTLLQSVCFSAILLPKTTWFSCYMWGVLPLTLNRCTDEK